ncbi:HU family DNA-binding protein [Sphingomonas sp. SUN019]|uniref:HU family DNA-binding protein n=1 Tax=Sphingomonas sp. SUN019 TaxID=2937788 RepID=UPI0021640A32|nr:HU family DNA-binding protein [Sphingomonas sp. SUN019]UVO50159.1 HU family DNA-binding protein [Sphingomonas sp. SUN019]
MTRTPRIMVRSDLIASVTADVGDARVADDAVKFVFEATIAHLAKGGRVERRGFGAFPVRSSTARTTKSSRSGDPLDLPSRSLVFFRRGQALRADVAQPGATA